MFAERLKRLREKKGNVSQASLADFLGISQQAVGLWERGKTTPDFDTLIKLSAYFCVTIDYMLGNNNVNNALSKNEWFLISCYRDSTQQGKEMLLDYAEHVLSKHKEKNASSVS